MPEKNIVEYLSAALRSGTMVEVERLLGSLHPAEIATLLESLPIPQRRIVWELLDVEQEGDILLEVNEEVRQNLIELTNDRELLLATEGLEIDDLADLINKLPDRVIQQILTGMDYQNRVRLEHVLSYDEDTAGGLMNPDVITVRDNITVDVALRFLKMKGELPENLDNVTVVDYSNRYLGVLPLSHLITKDSRTRIKHLVDKKAEPILVETPSSEVATLFEDRDLLSATVVDEKNKVVGRITVDDVMDVIRSEPQHERMGFAGASGEEDLFAPVYTSSKNRAVWLGINLLTAALAAWFISLFQDTLQQVIALAVLFPIVASMGGIAGSQTLIIAIRGLATGRLVTNNSPLLLLKEISVGLLNGAFWAVVVALFATLWFSDFKLGIIIGFAILANLICAAAAGVFIPIGLKKLGVDPALASSVVLTTITDIIGIVAFLGLATLFLI